MKEKINTLKGGTRYSYISIQPCGCLGIAVVDNPEHKRDVAKEVAKAIRLGERVKRVTSDSVRKMDWRCPKHRLEEALDSAISKGRKREPF